MSSSAGLKFLVFLEFGMNEELMHPMDLSDGGRSSQSTGCSLNVLKAGFLPQASYKKKNFLFKNEKKTAEIVIKDC